MCKNKFLMKQLHKKCKYEHTMNAIPQSIGIKKNLDGLI